MQLGAVLICKFRLLWGYCKVLPSDNQKVKVRMYLVRVSHRKHCSLLQVLVPPTCLPSIYVKGM